MNVLLYCPTAEKKNAEQVLNFLNVATSISDRPIVDLVDETRTSLIPENKNYDAVIIVYTPGVELSKSLFEVVRYLDRVKPPGRFIFLAKTGEKEIIPPIFHPIRAFQLRLYYFLLSDGTPNSLDAQLEVFKDDWNKFLAPIKVEQSGNKGRETNSNPVGFGLILLVSTLIIILAGLIAVIVPIAKDTLLKPTPTSMHPPTAINFWLQESFQSIDTTTRWQEQHYYSGLQALQTTFSITGMQLSASPVVTEAVFQLDSQQSWPLDELQSLSFSFAVSAMEDPAANNALVFGLYLSEDNSYRVDCLIVPAEKDGRIQCQIQSPSQAEALSDAIPFSLGMQHTATLVFDSLTYTFQFFLDDHFYGQREIQAVEFWRTREVKLQVKAEEENLNRGSFSCELYSLRLAHLP